MAIWALIFGVVFFILFGLILVHKRITDEPWFDVDFIFPVLGTLFLLYSAATWAK